MQLVTLIFILWGLLGIYTSGKVSKDPKIGSPLVDFEFSVWRLLLMIFFIPGMYWGLTFWNNLSDFITSAAAVNYYFEEESIITPAVWKTIFYHMGTVALGSLVLMPVTLIQLIFGWFHSMFRSDSDNCIKRTVSKLCFCCCFPYEKYFMRVNEEGFCMTYLASSNFCSSSKQVYYVKKRHNDRIGDANFIGFLYSWAGRLTVGFLTALVCYQILTRIDYFKTNLNNPLIPTLVRILPIF